MKKRLLIGIAGASCSGKNYVANLLTTQNFCVRDCLETIFTEIDCDKLVVPILQNNAETIQRLFGMQAEKENLPLLKNDNTLNKTNLSKYLFSHPDELKKHEQWILPKVQENVFTIMEENETKNFLVNGAVLHKTEIIERCDFILFVTAPLLVRIFRAKKRDNISFFRIFKRFFAGRRLFSQYLKKNADIYKVRNFGSKKRLTNQLNSIFKHFYC